MFRHPHYLEAPWDIQGHPVTTVFLIGVGVTQGVP